MENKDQKALTPRSVDQSEWYTQVVQRAKLADYSPVKGCMVIRPYGYAIWERIQMEMDKKIKEMGVDNAYFPLFIPYSFLEREADHVEGFAPEVAMVTHAGGEELEEKLVVRPTSETIMYEMFGKWVHSYRDLPLQINQWANVVRWEKRTQLFLRTTEFLWQEGHTAHATKEEAEQMVRDALDMYHTVARDLLAMYTIKGFKTEKEKFAGADYTTTIEAMMKDGKALQSGTSHLLGQNFAKSFDVKFLDQTGAEQYVWQTSWGLSTRVIGGLILMHGDDKGLILPPNIAPKQILIVPIFKAETEAEVRAYVAKLESQLSQLGIRFETDWSDNSPGWKFSEGEMRGIPLRLEVGPKDVANEAVMSVSRVDGSKTVIKFTDLATQLPAKLAAIQSAIYKSAQEFTENNTFSAQSEEEFTRLTAETTGFISAFFCGDKQLEKQIQEKTKFTTRCIPFATIEQEGKCIFTGKAGKLTLFARAY
jgi:prolyl-tRNA synthetase